MFIESSTDKHTEKMNQWGLLLSMFTYGAHVALFTCYLRALSRRRKPILLVYTATLFVVATVAIGLQAWWTQVAFVDNRYYPGGPTQFLLDSVDGLPNRALTALYLCMNGLADGLILYRFYVLCACKVIGCRLLALLFVIPCSAALLVTAVVFFSNISGLGLNLWTSASISPGIAYMALSLSVNITLTMLIICRLLLIRRSLRQALGPHHGQTYTSLVAMFIESASLYTIFALTIVILCGTSSTLQYVFLPMLGQLQAIPPLLITTRVAEGQAISRSTYSKLSTQVRFSPPSPIRTVFSTFTNPHGESLITPVEPSFAFARQDFGCRFSSLSYDTKGTTHEFDSISDNCPWEKV